MAEANNYTVTHKELVELIIKHAGIHDGKWVLSATLGFAPGNFGPSPDQLSPGTVVAIQQIGIVRAEAATPQEIQVDAAAVNPKR
jgi:hypothetical protein